MVHTKELQMILRKYRAHYIVRGNMETTADQVVEKLGRILSEMEREYGVRFTEDKIMGMTNRTLLEWNAALGQKGRKPSTINNYIVILNPFLVWAIDMEYLDVQEGKRQLYDVLKTVKLPSRDRIPESQRKQEMFSVDEVVRLMNGITGRTAVRDRAILAVLLGSGIRASELCSLDIDGVLGRPKGTIYLRRKGGEYKETPLAEFAYPFIEEYLRKSRSKKNMAAQAPLFLSRKGGAMDRVALWKVLAANEKRLGLTTGVHILRHTVISEAERVGSVATARDIANHKSISMTNRYDHSSVEERHEAVSKFRWNDLSPS